MMLLSTHRSSRSGAGTVSHSQAARALGMESSVDPEDDSDSGSEEEGSPHQPEVSEGER